MATCYRHPSQETGVNCSNCGRPICPDCMIHAAVGIRCPECAKSRTRVHNPVRSGSTLYLTTALVIANVLIFFAEIFTGGSVLSSGDSRVLDDGALFGPSIAYEHQYWRLLTSGFIHLGVMHLLLNMYMLFILGRIIEQALGVRKMALIYVTALFGGSLGVMVLRPDQPTVGASGAVFGLMAAAFIFVREQGNKDLEQRIGLLLAINLFYTFSASGISVGGHLGGIVGGAAAYLIFIRYGSSNRPKWLPYLLCLALTACFIVLSVAFAGHGNFY